LLNIEIISLVLKNRLNEKRYLHSLGVMKTAEELAKIYDAPVEKAIIAGLVHDCAKNLNSNQMLKYAFKFDILLDGVTNHQIQLLHGHIGAELAKNEFGINDIDILNAIRFHTTGRENMSTLEKIIFLADFIEPNRAFPGVDKLRNMALFNLDKATFMALNHTIKHVITKGELLHVSTVHARNFLLEQLI